MRKVLHKVKSQWIVLGVMGATVVALGTVNVPGVSADEVNGQTVSGTSDTNAGNALTVDLANIQEATVVEVGDPSAVSNPYDFYDWYESMGVDSYANGMRFYIDGLDRTIQLYVKTANDTGELYLTITQMGATAAEDVILIGNQIINPNTYYIFAEGQDSEPIYFSIVNRNADNYVEPNYNRFEEVSEASVDPLNIKNYSPELYENVYASEGLHFYESDGQLIGQAVVFVEMLGRYAPTAGGEIKYDTVYKFVDDNNEIEYFKVVKETSTTDSNFSQIVSETVVDYPAKVSGKDNAINTQPWNVEGWQNIGNSSDILNQTVDVTKEQVTDYGVTWALVSLNGKELGWIAKDALAVQTYAAITSETVVDYPATISRGTDAINLAPWGTKGYQTIASSAAYVGKTVDVIKEQTTDYGVTWAQISLNGEVLGWIAKDALAVQTYAAVVSETVVDYPATVNRDSDAINTAPWGVKGYQTLSSSAAYAGQTVEVTKEQVTDYGVTWAQILLNGEVLGWIAKDALKIQTYAQITKETDVDYSATISRDSDAINTAPWGVKGYQTLSSSAAFVGQTVEVTKEQITDYGVTWALVSQNGKELGWIAKDALKVQTYAQITKEAAVSYDAIVNRDSDAINTAPWGVKGYQTLSSSAAYVGQTVEVTKEQVTDYGVTWALVSQNGKELGWIAKDALKVQTYAQIIKETAVNYDAIVNRDSDAINTAPWGVKGYKILSSSSAYAGKTVEVSKEQVTDYGVTWAQISLNGEELGWIAKDALKVQTYSQIVSENEVAYPALINRGTDAINTAPWGTKGYQTNASSADYLGQTVEVTKEQTTDYGVTWSLVSLNGKELGWIAKDALTVMERTVGTVVAKENTVAYQTVTEEDNTIPIGERVVVQAGVEGYDTVTYDVTYVNGVETNRVEVSRTTTAAVDEIMIAGMQGAVKSIIVISEGDAKIVLNGKKLQMSAIVMPGDATETSVFWSVDDVTGTATIDDYGLLTATSSGRVTVKASAKDGSGIVGIKEITVAVPVVLSGYVGGSSIIELPEVIFGNQIDEFGHYDGFRVVENLDSNAVGIVTGIRYYAFDDDKLTSVVIPDSVTYIGSDAFSFNQLTSVVIPESVTSISSGAFGYNKLTSVVIPKSMISIGNEAFSFNQLASITIPENLTSIGSSAFSSNRLTSLVIPDSVTYIGSNAFTNNRLISVVISESITSIGIGTFSNNQLTNVLIPESVISIESDAFRNNKIESIVIPESVTSIGMGAFFNNHITSVVIPESVTNIGTDAFSNNQLTSVVIPKSMSSIEFGVFSNNLLNSIVIPDSVKRIGSYAFSNNQLTSLVIPESVSAIGNYTFQNNQLTSIVIPEGVTFIGNGAFSQNQLTSITIGDGVQVGDNLLGIFGSNNNFRTAYINGGAGTYTGSQDGEWIKISE